jgi:hypothetical protein
VTAKVDEARKRILKPNFQRPRISAGLISANAATAVMLADRLCLYQVECCSSRATGKTALAIFFHCVFNFSLYSRSMQVLHRPPLPTPRAGAHRIDIELRPPAEQLVRKRRVGITLSDIRERS